MAKQDLVTMLHEPIDWDKIKIICSSPQAIGNLRRMLNKKAEKSRIWSDGTARNIDALNVYIEMIEGGKRVGVAYSPRIGKKTFPVLEAYVNELTSKE